MQVGFGQFVANEVHLAAKAGAGLPQPALERPRRAPQLGADPRDVRLSIADGARDCRARLLDDFFLLGQLPA